MAAHVEFIKQKYYTRAWLLRHLKGAGVPEKDVATIFATTIRPVLEYAAPVYHPMLNQHQSDEIESLQRRSLKVIFGPETSYRTAMEKAVLPSLTSRREDIFRKFAKKTSGR